jgi:hypothetical protein
MQMRTHGCVLSRPFACLVDLSFIDGDRISLADLDRAPL